MLSFKEILLPLIAVVLIIAPLFYFYRQGSTIKNAKKKLLAQVAIFSGVYMVVAITQFGGIDAFAAGTTTTTTAVATASLTGTLAQGLGFVSAALATGLSCVGAGVAVAAAAPAAIGAISENGDNFGRALIFVALGEGVAIYGLIISILIIIKL